MSLRRRLRFELTTLRSAGFIIAGCAAAGRERKSGPAVVSEERLCRRRPLPGERGEPGQSESSGEVQSGSSPAAERPGAGCAKSVCGARGGLGQFSQLLGGARGGG